MVSFAAVAENVATLFDAPLLLINFGVITFLFSYVIFNFPSIFALEKGNSIGYGVKLSVSNLDSN